MNNLYTKESLINSLKTVKENALSGAYKDRRGGICHQWNDLNSDCLGEVEYNIVSELSKSWEHHSGDESYPIDGVDTHFSCSEKRSLWKGEQLTLRLSLIDHILGKLESMSQEDVDTIVSE